MLTSAGRTKIDHGVPTRCVYEPPAADCANLYEQGQVLLFDQFDVTGIALGFLRQLPNHQETKRLKKLKLKEVEQPLDKDRFDQHVLGVLFPGDYERAVLFQAQSRLVTAKMDAMVARLFPSYKVVGTSHSWRISESFAEGLHCDSYDDRNDELLRLRCFVNYDKIPRIWNMSLDALQLHEKFWHATELHKHLEVHPNALNGVLTRVVPWGSLPRTTFFFAPLSCWLCDTQLNSHEIVYGRRAWAYTYAVEPKSLVKPDHRFVQRVRSFAATKVPK